MSIEWPFGISHDHTIPVYVQIENHVKFAIASGRLNPGDTLPSVRALAQLLDVNQNTVTKAYRDLELLDIVTTRRGVGVMVSPTAKQQCAAKTQQMVLRHLAEAVAECIASGVSDAAVRKSFESALTAKEYPYSGTR